MYQEIARNLGGVMVGIESEAQATDVFGDDTGATRGSIVGYVVAGNGVVDQSGKAEDAYAYAEGRRPGSATNDFVEVSRTEIAAFLTVFTFYAPELEARNAGEGGFIGQTMDENSSRLHKAVESAIKKVTG